MRICVYGAASDAIAPIFKQDAEALGKELALQGFELVFGGGATGVMGAVAKGALDAHARVIGVAPRFFDREGVLEKRCTQLIFTDTMRQRKEKMEALSDAFIMAPGGMGTFEEFFEILTLRQLGRHQKPIAVLNTNGYYEPLEQLLASACECGFVAPAYRGMYELASTPQQAVGAIREKLCAIDAR